MKEEGNDDFDPLSIDQAAINKSLTGCPDCVFIPPTYFSIDDAWERVVNKLKAFRPLGDEIILEAETTFESLGLEGETLRKFELRFYSHSGEWVRKDSNGYLEYQDPDIDKRLRPVPATLGEFVQHVYDGGKNSGFNACNRHY